MQITIITKANIGKISISQITLSSAEKRMNCGISISKISACMTYISKV